MDALMTNGTLHDADGVVLEDAPPAELNPGAEGGVPTPPPVRSRVRPIVPVAVQAATPGPEDGADLRQKLELLQKTFGNTVVRRASTNAAFTHLGFDILTLDMATFGGLPEGCMTMIYGWESAGKTLLAMRLIAAAQAKYPGKSVILFDLEGTYAKEWGAVHGIDNERLVIVQPQSGEQAVNICDTLLQSVDVSLVVVDSLPALLPTKELESDAENATVALQARMIGRFVRRANFMMIEERKKKHIVSIILINQWRSKITMMGDPRALPGGNSLRFFCVNMIEIKNKEELGKNARGIECVDHNTHTFTIKKNKIGNGIRSGEFIMIRNPDHPLGPGFIDEGKVVLNYAKRYGLLSGAGANYKLVGFNGGPNDKAMKMDDIIAGIYDDKATMTTIKNAIIARARQEAGLSSAGWN